MSYSIKSVVKGASLFSGSQLLTKGASFLLIPIYTRYLSPYDYGIIGYFQVYFQLFSIIFIFGFAGAQTRYYHDHHVSEDATGSFIFTINAFLFFVLLLLIVFSYLFGEKVFYSIITRSGLKFSPFFYIVLGAVFFNIYYKLLLGYSLAKKQFVKCAAIQLSLFFFTTGATIFYITYLDQGAVGQFKGLLIGNCAVCICFYWNYINKGTLSFSLPKLKYALHFGAPIAIHLVSASFLNYVDRVVLGNYVSIDQLGIYTIGYQCGMIMSIIVGAFNQAWSVNYYELMKKNDRKQIEKHVRRMFNLWMSTICIVCIIGCLWSREIILFMLPDSYRPAIDIIPVILCSFIFQGIYYFHVNPIFYYKKTKLLPIITGLSGVLNIVLNILFIPKYGIIAAAYTTMVSYLLMAILVSFISKKIFNPKYENLKVIVLVLLLFLFAIVIHLPKTTFIYQIIKCVEVGVFVCITYGLFRVDFKFKKCFGLINVLK